MQHVPEQPERQPNHLHDRDLRVRRESPLLSKHSFLNELGAGVALVVHHSLHGLFAPECDGEQVHRHGDLLLRSPWLLPSLCPEIAEI